MEMSFRPFVYGLCDPLEPGHIRYVGMASMNESRPYVHAKLALRQTEKHSHLFHWIRKLKSEGRDYIIVKLEELQPGCRSEFVGYVESCYIDSLREIGHELTNVC